MKRRKVVIFTGQAFKVPEHIVRADSRKTHGWQVRYGHSTIGAFFSDHSNDGSGAGRSLKAATRELLRRIRMDEAPTGLRRGRLPWKASPLPVGVSGPGTRLRRGRKIREFYFQVSAPRFGGKSRNLSIYIATEHTITQEKHDLALAKALELRRAAVAQFQFDATQAIRARYSKDRKRVGRIDPAGSTGSVRHSPPAAIGQPSIS